MVIYKERGKIRINEYFEYFFLKIIIFFSNRRNMEVNEYFIISWDFDLKVLVEILVI